MTHTLDQLVGTSLPHGYVLEKFLSEEDGAALYRTSLRRSAQPAEEHGGEPDSQPALLKLITAHSAAPGQLAAWERLSGISHSNVLGVVDCGRVGPLGPDGGHFLYAVFEYPEDHLDTALDAGLLSEADARDVLAAIEAGLHFLHAHGLAQTLVDPHHIVAVGDRIKLFPEAAILLGPSATESADWKATSALRIRLMDAVGAAPPGAPEIDAEPAAPAPPESAPEPQRRAPAPLDSTTEQLRHTMLPLWGYVALAIAAVFLLVLALRPKQPAAAPQPAPPVVAQVPAGHPIAPHPAAAPTQPIEPANWRVVAYTYNKRKDADHKVAQINAKFPGFVPEVFSPRGAGQAPYLVALGGRMTRAQAQSLQRDARAKGMPPGTYIQNFKN
jgi:hypothetical protein